MNIIEMIVLTLIGILLTNAVAWFMVYRQGNQIKEMLEDEAEARKCVEDIKWIDDDV